MKADVFITNSWNRVGYQILRSLSEKGLIVFTGDSSKCNICSFSNRSTKSFVYADYNTKPEKFIDDLLGNINKYSPKVLIPTHDEGIIISKYRYKFPKDLIILVEDHNKILNISDKEIASKIALKIGIPTPTIFANSKEIIDFPVVIKPTIGNSARNVFYANSDIELKKHQLTLSNQKTLIQSFINGTDFSVVCLRMNDFFFALTYKSIVNRTYRGGNTTQREIVACPILVDYARKIMDEIDFKGVVGIDFKLDKTSGKFYFIEINPRYTGGIATPILAGFDIPYWHYRLGTNKSVELLSIKFGVKTKWILGDIIAVFDRIKNKKFVLNDFKQILNFKADSYDDFYKDDIFAFFGEVAYYFTKLLKMKS